MNYKQAYCLYFGSMNVMSVHWVDLRTLTLFITIQEDSSDCYCLFYWKAEECVTGYFAGNDCFGTVE